VASKFLVVSLDYLGSVPADPVLARATKSQQLVLRSHPHANSSLALRKIGKNLSGYRNMETMKGGIQFFWEQLFGVALKNRTRIIDSHIDKIKSRDGGSCVKKCSRN
jgi:flagellar biosynthesis protein FlhG